MAAATASLPSSLFAGQIKSGRNARIAKFATRVQARFSFGKKKAKFAPPPPKRGQSVGWSMWLPGSKPPEWLDGSLVGDYGFDPLGLGKPTKYLQYELDYLDQNLEKINSEVVLVNWVAFLLKLSAVRRPPKKIGATNCAATMRRGL